MKSIISLFRYFIISPSYLFTFFLFSFTFHPLFSQNYEQVLKEGILHAYNFEFNEAEKKFRFLTESDVDNPKGYLALANIYVWQYLTDNNSSAFNKFEFYSEKTQTKTKEILEKDKNNFEAKYCYTTIQGYKTLIFLISKKYSSGIWSAKECLFNAKELKKNNTDFFDIYLWSGLFKFAFAQIPTSLQYLLKVAGIDANFFEGMEELKIASVKSTYNKIEATYFLSQIYSIYLDSDENTLRILTELNNKFPQNVLFSYSLASQLIKDRKLKESEILLKDILSKTTNDYKKINVLSSFLLGDIYFFQGDYSKAKSFYLKYIQNHYENEYKNTAYFRIAISCINLNESNEADNYFLKGSEQESFNEEGEYYKNKCSLFSERKITQNELKILVIENSLKNSDFKNSHKIISDYSQKYGDSESIQKINYFKGLLNFLEGDINKAMVCFSNSSKENFENENWILPFAKYYLAKIYIRINEKEKALDLLNETLKNKDFYFENSLKLKIQFLLNFNLKDKNEI